MELYGREGSSETILQSIPQAPQSGWESFATQEHRHLLSDHSGIHTASLLDDSFNFGTLQKERNRALSPNKSY